MHHQITKPSPRRCGGSLFKTRENDAENDVRIKIKFKEWHDHWQVGPEIARIREDLAKPEAQKGRSSRPPPRVGVF